MSSMEADVYIFAKDNQHLLAFLLRDLNHFRDHTNLRGSFTVVDDSVLAKSRKEIDRLAQQSRLPLCILRSYDQQRIRSAPSGQSPWTRRRLGVPGFDVATCRNVAFAHALSANDVGKRPQLFLDADIRLEPCALGRVAFDASGFRAMIHMISAVAASDRVISGAPLVGRADISMLEHLDHQSRAAQLSPSLVASLAKRLVPAMIATKLAGELSQPLGMSGGAFCASANALREAPMTNAYNEDLLWLAYLRHLGYQLVPAPHPLVHADPKPLSVTSPGLRQHAVGEALWDIVEQYAWPIPGGRSLGKAWTLATDWIRNNLLATAKRIQDLAEHSTSTTSVSQRRQLTLLARLIRRNAEWTAAIPSEVCRKAFASFDEQTLHWKRLWKTP